MAQLVTCLLQERDKPSPDLQYSYEKLGMAVHAFNPSTWGQGQEGPEASLLKPTGEFTISERLSQEIR